MKIKLDENMPGVAVAIQAAHGHEVVTVVDESLAGARDPTIAQAAAIEGRMLVTMDRGFADIRSYPRPASWRATAPPQRPAAGGRGGCAQCATGQPPPG